MRLPSSRLLIVVIGIAALVPACGMDTDTPGPSSGADPRATPIPSQARPAGPTEAGTAPPPGADSAQRAPSLVLGYFVGEVNPAIGYFSIRPLASLSDAPSAREDGMRVATQGLCDEDDYIVQQDGTPGTGSPDTIEVVTDGGSLAQDIACFGTWNPLFDPPLFCADVTVRSFYAGLVLDDVYAEILSMSDTNHLGWNSAAEPSPGNPPSDVWGLWSYGDIDVVGNAPANAVERPWIFERNNDTFYSFLGRIVGAASETCDGIDNDCDGAVDNGAGSTWYADLDGDLFGDPGSPQVACAQPANYVADSSDCDDTDANTAPGEPEFCDGIDNDCDSVADGGWCDDSIYIAGTIGNALGGDCWLLEKFDADSNRDTVGWAKQLFCLGPGTEGSRSTVADLEFTANGELLVSGYIPAGCIPDTRFSASGTIRGFDSDGNSVPVLDHDTDWYLFDSLVDPATGDLYTGGMWYNLSLCSPSWWGDGVLRRFDELTGVELGGYYHTYLNWTDYDGVTALAMNSVGDVYVDFVSHPGTHYYHTLYAYNAAGTQLWSQSLDDGIGVHTSTGEIEFDAIGDLYHAGASWGVAEFGGLTGVVVRKYDASATSMQWRVYSSFNYIDGWGDGLGRHIAVDADTGDVYLAHAYHNGTDLDWLLRKFDTAGNEVFGNWPVTVDLGGDEMPQDIILAGEHLYVVGRSDVGPHLEGLASRYSTDGVLDAAWSVSLTDSNYDINFLRVLVDPGLIP